MTTRLLCALALAVSTTGCTMKNPLATPVPVTGSRYEGLIDEADVRLSRDRIVDAQSKTLAVVLSSNVPNAFDYNAQLRASFGDPSQTMSKQASGLVDDLDIIFSNDRIVGALLDPLRARFKNVTIVKDMPAGFEGGADYVGILDLSFSVRDADYMQSMRGLLVIPHTANASMVFFDPNLAGGPEVVADIAYEQRSPARGPDANNLEILTTIKNVRTKMAQTFAEQVALKISR